MKARIVLLILVILFVAAFTQFSKKAFATPIQISTCQGLQDMGLDVTADYELSADIDCTFDTQNPLGALYNGGSGFAPINNFSGTFNGNSHAITGLLINRPATSDVGLFGYLALGTVSNVSLVSADITGNSSVGTLVGAANSGTITNSSSTGSVSGTASVGGLIGVSNIAISGLHSSAVVTGTDHGVGGLIGDATDSISSSYATGSVTGSGGGFVGYAGGLVGESTGSTIADSYATGNVSAPVGPAGGLVGYMAGTSVTGSYATGDVSADSGVGGLIGYSDATVSTSYATGNVTGTGSGGVGGLIGQATADVTNTYARGNATGSQYIGGLIGVEMGGTLSTSYATGLVTGTSDKGGLIGSTFGTPSYGYWDKDTTGMTTSAGSDPSYGKTTAEMKTESTFLTWDFATIWGIDLTAVINDGYPYLQWQSPSPPPVPTAEPTPTPASPPGPPSPCEETAPPTAPVLFQAVRTGSKVKLWFTPVNANTTGYAIIYGYFPGDERFGVFFDQGYSPGALTYEIDHLQPQNSYTFKIQAKNNCASGPWSNYISVGPAGGGGKPTPTPTSTATPISTPTPNHTPSPTPSPIPSMTPEASPSGTPFIESIFTPAPATESGTPSGGSDIISVIESHSEDLANITDTGVAAGSGLVAVAVVGEISGIAFVVAKPLYSAYKIASRPIYIYPIDYIGSVGQGLWQLIVGFFGPLYGLVRKKPGAGIVFDGANGKPVSAAYIVLFSPSGNLSTSFTDRLGQYELKPKPDTYDLRVDKDLYSFPSRLVTVTETVSYTRVYVPGEKFEIKNEGEKFDALAIPIDPAKFKSVLSASFAKARQVMSFMISRTLLILEILGVIVSGLAAFTNPGPLYKLIFGIITAFAIFDIAGRLVVRRVLKSA